LIFEEFLWLSLAMGLRREGREHAPKGTTIEINDHIRDVVRAILPFKPTGAQKRVLREIVTDMSGPRPMNRLLQGDVGSGKTIVAVQAAVVAIENGYQAALMAPTEILAEQHAKNIKQLLQSSGHSVELLTGSLSASRKRTLRNDIDEGRVDFAVGTHALIQEGVRFQKLGLVIIDEQHRFGVMQRGELMKRGYNPDVLVMSATPIPRSLVMSVYGDLDLSVIDEMPPGRKPVVTRVRGEEARNKIYKFLDTRVREGDQVYIVYPLVEESEKLDLLNATQMAEHLQTEVFPKLHVGLIHGRMKQDEKDRVMAEFRRGEIQMLVATTVIEVGVDVPNASVMVIEHAAVGDHGRNQRWFQNSREGSGNPRSRRGDGRPAIGAARVQSRKYRSGPGAARACKARSRPPVARRKEQYWHLSTDRRRSAAAKVRARGGRVNRRLHLDGR
jgi:ATP-dependent DNA helicase RecG